MKPLLLALLVTALPAWSAAPPSGCAALCGEWVLDATRSDAAEPLLTESLRSYKDPRRRHVKTAPVDDTVATVEADMENSIGPILNRPRRDDLRTELLPLVTPPQTVGLSSQKASILISAPGRAARKVTVGTPHARVDSVGTAKIRGSWKGSTLTISETYDRKRGNTETYVLQSADATLVVIREIRRPGMKPLRIRSVYRRT